MLPPVCHTQQRLLSKLNSFDQNFMKLIQIVYYHDIFFKFDSGPYGTMSSGVMALRDGSFEHPQHIFIPRQSWRDIVLASSVRSSVRPSGTISQFLWVRFDSFLVQMISTMASRYPICLVKIDPLTLELLPLF